MSKLLDLLQRISDGSPAPLGFGASRAESVPGMVLVGRAGRPGTGRRPSGVPDAASSLDAVIVDGASGSDYIKQLGALMSELPWGPYLNSPSDEDAQASRDCGADVLAFSLESGVAAISGEDDLARLVSVTGDLSDRELRAVSALPVDGFILDMTGVSGEWTLQDLVSVGSMTRRTDKHVLVQVSAAPAKSDLEALRDMGAGGLIIEVTTGNSAELAALKADLLGMARPRPRRRDRIRATVPGSGFTPSRPPDHDDDGDDDDYDE
ncbi:MAG: hypothetical protein F4X65_05805 [Chloroflexi bacterium]|nr:hypothetical protein [Chloroflexota bacterium]